MLNPHSKVCPICNAIIPAPLTGRGRVYCSKPCYQEATRQRSEWRHSNGFCRCGRLAIQGLRVCTYCRPKDRERTRKRHLKRRGGSQCANCSNERRDGNTLCEICINKRAAHNRRRRAEMRRKILDAYGQICVCCGETLEMLLTIDHVYGDGSAHRKELGFKTAFYIERYLIQNNFPKDRFQILCYNCNIGRYRNGGICPHLNTLF